MNKDMFLTRKKSRFFEFLKEWGSVATLVIALLYTFPTSLFDRLTETAEKKISRARQTISDAAALLIEQQMNSSKLSDPRTLDAINTLYNVRFYNMIYSNGTILKDTYTKLSPGEISTLGSLFAQTGNVDEAIEYIQQAIAKAEGEKPDSSHFMRRDLSQAYYMRGKPGDLSEARKGYQTVLRFLKTQQWGRSQHAKLLSEFGYLELIRGDWACGEALIGPAQSALANAALGDPAISQIKAMFDQNLQYTSRGATQSADGCPFDIGAIN